MNQKKFVLFDNDGTLVNSEPLAMKVVADYVVEKAAQQMITIPHKEVLALFGKTIQQILDINADIYGVKFLPTSKDSILEETVDVLAKQVQQVDGCRDFLRFCYDLKRTGAVSDMALVTSSEFKRVKPGLNRNGLSDFFGDERMFSANDTLVARYGKPIPKPDPAIYNLAKEILGIQDGDVTITFEDSGTGVASAKAAGITHIVAFLGAGHIPEDIQAREAYTKKLQDLGATHVICHWYEAADLMVKLVFTEPKETPVYPLDGCARSGLLPAPAPGKVS